MRKIESQMLAAIRLLADRGGPNEQTWTLANTAVRYNPVVGGAELQVFLHGNLIAERRLDSWPNTYQWRITLAGWNTPTTRSRLSAICREFGPGNSGVVARKGQPMLVRSGHGTPISATEWVAL